MDESLQFLSSRNEYVTVAYTYIKFFQEKLISDVCLCGVKLSLKKMIERVKTKMIYNLLYCVFIFQTFDKKNK